jgi:hypothetical protein
VVEQAEPSGAVETARCELAAEFLEDLRRSGVQMRDTKKKLAVVVKAAGTTLTAVRAVRQRCIRGIAVTRVVWQGTG